MSKKKKFNLQVKVVNPKTGKIITESIPFDQLSRNQKAISKLNPEQITRIKRIYSILDLDCLLGDNFENWAIQFTFDIFPENEIRAWEKITFVFLEFIKRHPYDLTLNQKKDILFRLLKLSFGESPNDASSMFLYSFWEELTEEFRKTKTKNIHEQTKVTDQSSVYVNPWDTTDFEKLAFAYNKYTNQHNLSSEEDHDIFVRLMHLMAGQDPKDALSRELLHILVNEFDPHNITDDRVRVSSPVVRRKGQSKFRHELIKAYKGKCAITGYSVDEVLQAAHIIPYLGSETNHPSNGILLRVDIHILFDKYLLSIHPKNYEVIISPSLCGTDYEGLSGKKLLLPDKDRFKPNSIALEQHYQTFLQKCEK
ncbi:HNH endonuclease [Nostoc sp. XA010]|uniref:HNH endonuclease n=1 Tax=Nostoc sp. XA010 TaxID=2780407 RepID=UPI001E4629A2|nr:HNH endonuclease [Nostoc sp. XA010]MCC5659092.1 HNH endonuclease [Nostoc sp. XA010]